MCEECHRTDQVPSNQAHGTRRRISRATSRALRLSAGRCWAAARRDRRASAQYVYFFKVLLIFTVSVCFSVTFTRASHVASVTAAVSCRASRPGQRDKTSQFQVESRLCNDRPISYTDNVKMRDWRISGSRLSLVSNLQVQRKVATSHRGVSLALLKA